MTASQAVVMLPNENENQSPLLKLPPDLRNAIYELAVIKDSPFGLAA